MFLENYTKLDITVGEAMLLIHLLSFKWTREAPFPSLTRLASLMGCSERNIRKLCASLEGVGYLRRVSRTGQSNQFDLSGLYAKLEEIMNAAARAAAIAAGAVVPPPTHTPPADPVPPHVAAPDAGDWPPQVVTQPSAPASALVPVPPYAAAPSPVTAQIVQATGQG